MHSSALQCNYALCICNLIHRRGRTLCVQAAWLPLALPCCARMHAAPLCQITSGFQVAACAQARCPGPLWRAPCARQRARWRRRCSARSARRAATWSWTPSSWSDRVGSRRRDPDRRRPCRPYPTPMPANMRLLGGSLHQFAAQDGLPHNGHSPRAADIWRLPAGQATAGSLQSLCWASSALGSVASAYFSGALVEAWGPRSVFGLTAVFPLVVSAAAALIDEQPAAPAKLKADEGQPGGRPPLLPWLASSPLCQTRAAGRSRSSPSCGAMRAPLFCANGGRRRRGVRAVVPARASQEP